MTAAGRLNKKVSIRKLNADTAANEYVEGFTVTFQRWAAIEPLVGREYFEASGENSEVSVRFRLRYDSKTKNITAKDQVDHNGTIYQIVSPPINPRMQNREIILMCKAHDRQH